MNRGELTANGVRLSFLEEGDAGEPVVLLLHGLPSDATTWEHTMSGLAPTHHAYALDQRGQGRSDWPGEYSFELMRDDVLGFADGLGLREVTLVGHSAGGTVACLVAQERPSWLARLVVEDSPPPRPGAFVIPVPDRPEHELDYDWPVMPSLLRQLNEPDPAWWERLAEIAVPTLLISGGATSPLPVGLAAEAVARIPDAKLVTIEAGHQVHRVRPEEFLAELRAFLPL
ncbi:MAG: alpha/beta hydrolase [Hamadaea sp.]|uniref:alpha/beta fold hydrolase n=1 Tax=Hamadaea sp. TaxID=2024425 RepID=UPI00179BF09B|nr:alpha/beta hydrolase [Hamadaea sp.]NUR72320.1 alpha/beta hydrolase [Hamadaea sp.]NUT18704.1 alpha/beta hydrolase [Hamadaea sp.]